MQSSLTHPQGMQGPQTAGGTRRTGACACERVEKPIDGSPWAIRFIYACGVQV
ncbi:hypothetical protein DPMN_046186 [Dreissena polymorpha]|uniref:Uncharacterized protein n=1 Tax=Dreissena polymorpha TaxID=45954 RepID=A0A9D4D956_DREPO|nr:hypothetical protein DPMN_046186 [Dreissena polymorpha]